VDGVFSDGFVNVSDGTFSEEIAGVAAVALSLGTASPFTGGGDGVYKG
jgi:hypothetical protein